MITERILQQLKACDTAGRNFPPTVLYNENWMLRIILDWFNPLIEKIEIEIFSWEDIINNMVKIDSEYGGEMQNFYHKCLP
jgi:hypothetical protein